jgi:hypothetical protein
LVKSVSIAELLFVMALASTCLLWLIDSHPIMLVVCAATSYICMSLYSKVHKFRELHINTVSIAEIMLCYDCWRVKMLWCKGQQLHQLLMHVTHRKLTNTMYLKTRLQQCTPCKYIYSPNVLFTVLCDWCCSIIYIYKNVTASLYA